MHYLDVVGGDPEFLCDDLGEGRLVALPLGLNRQSHNGFAGRVHAELTAVGHAETENVHVLAWARPDRLGEERHADAHQFTARAPLFLLGAQALS